MVISDFDRFVIRHGLMPSCNPDTLIWVHGSIRAHLSHLRDLGVGDFVLMKFNGSYWDVPAEYSARVFLKGGEFVNE